MPVSLPHCGCGALAGHRGGRDGGQGRGGQGNPLPSRKHNAMLMSNLRNTTLAASISPLPHTPALRQAAAVPPPVAVDGPWYCHDKQADLPLLRG